MTWISREEGSATRAAVETARWQIGLRVVRTLELPSWEAVKLAVASGAGIAAISRFALGLELEAGTLVVLDLPRWRVTRTIAAVTARDVPLTPPAANFLALLRETLSARPDDSRRRSRTQTTATDAGCRQRAFTVTAPEGGKIRTTPAGSRSEMARRKS